MTECQPTKLVQVLAFLALGLWIGFICGLGAAFGRMETVALQKAKIIGNVTVTNSGRDPIYFGGIHVEAKEGPAIQVSQAP